MRLSSSISYLFILQMSLYFVLTLAQESQGSHELDNDRAKRGIQLRTESGRMVRKKMLIDKNSTKFSTDNQPQPDGRDRRDSELTDKFGSDKVNEDEEYNYNYRSDRDLIDASTEEMRRANINNARFEKEINPSLRKILSNLAKEELDKVLHELKRNAEKLKIRDRSEKNMKRTNYLKKQAYKYLTGKGEQLEEDKESEKQENKADLESNKIVKRNEIEMANNTNEQVDNMKSLKKRETLTNYISMKRRMIAKRSASEEQKETSNLDQTKKVDAEAQQTQEDQDVKDKKDDSKNSDIEDKSKKGEKNANLSSHQKSEKSSSEEDELRGVEIASADIDKQLDSIEKEINARSEMARRETAGSKLHEKKGAKHRRGFDRKDLRRRYKEHYFDDDFPHKHSFDELNIDDELEKKHLYDEFNLGKSGRGSYADLYQGGERESDVMGNNYDDYDKYKRNYSSKKDRRANRKSRRRLYDGKMAKRGHDRRDVEENSQVERDWDDEPGSSLSTDETDQRRWQENRDDWKANADRRFNDKDERDWDDKEERDLENDDGIGRRAGRREERSWEDILKRDWDDQKDRRYDDKEQRDWDDKVQTGWDAKGRRDWDDDRERSWDDYRNKKREERKNEREWDDKRKRNWDDSRERDWQNKRQQENDEHDLVEENIDDVREEERDWDDNRDERRLDDSRDQRRRNNGNQERGWIDDQKARRDSEDDQHQRGWDAAKGQSNINEEQKEQVDRKISRDENLLEEKKKHNDKLEDRKDEQSSEVVVKDLSKNAEVLEKRSDVKDAETSANNKKLLSAKEERLVHALQGSRRRFAESTKMGNDEGSKARQDLFDQQKLYSVEKDKFNEKNEKVAI